MPHRVFISYKAEEYAHAQWVRDHLEAAGLLCWMAPSSIPGGSNYAIQIPKAIRECDVFVVVLSGKAQTSMWVPKELDQAINAGKVIMPFCIEDCPLREDFGFYLSNVQCYEAWRNRETAIAEMIRDIKKDGGPPLPPPPPPPPKPKRWLGPVFIAAAAALVIAIVIVIMHMRSSTQEEGAGSQHPSAGNGSTAIQQQPQDADGTGASASDNSADDSSALPEEPDDPGNEGSGEGTVSSGPVTIHYNTDGEVRILNKKYAQSAEFQSLANRFEEESGIRVTVDSPATGSYSETLAEEITGSRNDPTLFMLSGLKDFETYGTNCLDLSDCMAAGELLDDIYLLKGQNGKAYGLACIVESYGLCVNTRLLKKAGYDISEIQSFADLRRIARDITDRKKELGFSAFTSPSVGIGVSGDYRFSEHAPVVPLYYELKDNDFNIGLRLQGTYMDCFREYIDLYLNNSTVSRSEAADRSLEDAQKEFLMEKAVFHQDGSWNIGRIEGVMGDEAAVIPLYMGLPGEENQGLNKTCSYYWCVNKYASKDDIEATLQFLYWTVTSEEGIRILNKDMGFLIPYRKSGVPDNIFLETLCAGEAEGKEPINQYYKYGNYTNWTNSLRRSIRNYADGTGSWEEVEEAYKCLW